MSAAGVGVEKTLSITYSDRVFLAFGFLHVMLMRHIVVCDTSGCTVPYLSTTSHKRHDFREKIFWP